MDDPAAGAIAVTDHGFTVGDGVFEAVKTLHGQPFALTRHLARLERSAAGLGLPAPDLDDVRRLAGVTDLHELARFPDPLSPAAAARCGPALRAFRSPRQKRLDR